jgi:hypothetical protein
LRIPITSVVMHLCIIGVNPQGFVKMGNGPLILALANKNVSKIVMRSPLIGRFLHTIGPEFYFAIPNFISEIRSTSKEKDHKGIDDYLSDIGF